MTYPEYTYDFKNYFDGSFSEVLFSLSFEYAGLVYQSSTKMTGYKNK